MRRRKRQSRRKEKAKPFGWTYQDYPSPPPPQECARVRNGLKAKSLKGKMLCTENGRVRNKQKTRGLREDVPEAWDRKDLSQEAAGRPSCGWQARGCRGREGIVAWRIMPDITTEE